MFYLNGLFSSHLTKLFRSSWVPLFNLPIKNLLPTVFHICNACLCYDDKSHGIFYCRIPHHYLNLNLTLIFVKLHNLVSLVGSIPLICLYNFNFGFFTSKFVFVYSSISSIFYYTIIMVVIELSCWAFIVLCWCWLKVFNNVKLFLIDISQGTWLF